MNVFDMWMVIVGRHLCNHNDCPSCREVLGMDYGCPLETKINNNNLDEMSKFISSVTEVLRDRKEHNITISEEEFIDILESLL